MTAIDWAALRPGDPDPRQWGPADPCGRRFGDAAWTCGRPAHTDLVHVAGTGDRVCAVQGADGVVHTAQTEGVAR